MRATILSGGAMTDYTYFQQFLRPDDVIIAADSGYRHAEALCLRPRILLGDFDSLDHPPADIETLRIPRENDYTDTEFAVNWARAQGIRDFLFLGTIGTRMDHTLTNILRLSDLLDQGEHGEMIDEHNRIWITNSAIEIIGAPGALLSLIPLTPCIGVTTKNLAYPLQDATLYVGHGRGVSNVLLTETANIRLSSGKLLVMLCKD
ncbi:MAG: thiamine diphosphokinase [Oscillospiraceae bacterium]|nr:thiamine diphosphokinase [Oscillospiraceae bacterium]